MRDRNQASAGNWYDPAVFPSTFCRSPGFLTLSVSDNLEPKLWWLRDKLDVSLAGAAKMLTTYPNLFGLSIEASLEPKLW